MNVNDFIFSKTRANKKLETIKSMTNEEISKTSLDTIKRIANECKNKKGLFYIKNERRKGNNWNSVVEGIYVEKGRFFVEITYLGDSTDTSTSEYLQTFFRDGTYYGSTSYGSFSYSKEDKVRVLRSILEEYIYYKYLEKEEREKAEEVSKLLHYSILNPVLNKFYKELAPRHICLSWDEDNKRKYYGGQDAVKTYVAENYKALKGKSTEELQAIYTKIFEGVK